MDKRQIQAALQALLHRTDNWAVELRRQLNTKLDEIEHKEKLALEKPDEDTVRIVQFCRDMRVDAI